jgi:uncharacterized membrane protein YeiH
VEVAEQPGTVVFALSGVIAVASTPLDWFGAIVVGVVTALGGGTIRGLILGRTPVFWIEDQTFLLTAIIGSAVAAARVLAGRSATPFAECPRTWRRASSTRGVCDIGANNST